MGNQCIRKVDTSGNFTTIAGSIGSPGYSGDGGSARASAELNFPSEWPWTPPATSFRRPRQQPYPRGEGSRFRSDLTRRECFYANVDPDRRAEPGQLHHWTAWLHRGRPDIDHGCRPLYRQRAAPWFRCATWPTPWAPRTWDAATQTITITKGGTTVVLAIGSTAITTNGQTSQMDTAPIIVNGRTYLPARYVAEAFGCSVSWNAITQKVTVSR